jgi:hypothetical protein
MVIKKHKMLDCGNNEPCNIYKNAVMTVFPSLNERDQSLMYEDLFSNHEDNYELYTNNSLELSRFVFNNIKSISTEILLRS